MALKIAPVDVGPILDRVSLALQWLERKQMYVWNVEYTIEKLTKARNELKYTIEDVLDLMENAQHNGWSPRNQTQGWVREGVDIMNRADRTVVKFEDQLVAAAAAGDGSIVLRLMFHSPCDVLGRRVLNGEAVMRLYDITEHKAGGDVYLAGGFDAVACNRVSGGDPRTLPLEQRLDALVARAQLKASPAALLLDATTISSDADADADAVVPLSSVNDQNEEPTKPVGADMNYKVQLSAMAEYGAWARSQSHDNLPVMIRVRAPRYASGSRAALDLVIVLEISTGRTSRQQVEQVKQGAMFVVHNLAHDDRLSILTASETHPVLFPLTFMSDQQKAMARDQIRGLLLHGGPTGHVAAAAAIKTANQILQEVADKKRVSSIMLLTDGSAVHGSKTTPPIMSGQHYCYPTYTLAIGSDHDPRTMIYGGGRGTYSFVDGRDPASIKNAMALCVGGLTSIVAQRVKISIASAQEDVKIARIASGAYDHAVDDGKTSGSITVDDLCGGEEKSFLVFVKVPAAQGSMFRRTTKLLTVAADYYCPLTEDDHVSKITDQVEVSIKRPIKVRGQPSRNVLVQVASEVIRAIVLERVKEIWTAAAGSSSHSQHERQEEEEDDDDDDDDRSSSSMSIEVMIKRLQDSIGDSEEARAGKDRWDDLSTDLDEMQDRETGLHYMLSWLSSYQLQRAVVPGSTSMGAFSFRTTRMQNMIDSLKSAAI